ncbi:unnamed protein product [Thelazia callipaeda]|uniref:Uncharacterized protein n=1 Tax=Thelazia callipaeda TaxID=103827 RepID=A0A0N5CYZ1_THECL|nr:unnamed protein product [Thelazia callipaeda]
MRSPQRRPRLQQNSILGNGEAHIYNWMVRKTSSRATVKGAAAQSSAREEEKILKERRQRRLRINIIDQQQKWIALEEQVIGARVSFCAGRQSRNDGAKHDRDFQEITDSLWLDCLRHLRTSGDVQAISGSSVGSGCRGKFCKQFCSVDVLIKVSRAVRENRLPLLLDKCPSRWIF